MLCEMNSAAFHGKNASASAQELRPPSPTRLHRRQSAGGTDIDSSLLTSQTGSGLGDTRPEGIRKRSTSTCDVNEGAKGTVLKELLSRAISSLDPCAMSGWYSLSGYLQLKFLGGGFTAFLRSKRRYYFVLDEINCQLAYYKDHDDFSKKKTPTGNIELKSSAVTLNETKPRIFTLHTIGGRQYELEAESEDSALVWLDCLQKRSACKQDTLTASDTTNSSFCSGLTADNDPSSLPSETQLAAALDSALLNCTQSSGSFTQLTNTQKSAHHSFTVPPQRPCEFYFGSRSGSIAASSSTGQADPRSPPGSPIEEHPDAAIAKQILDSPSAISLHFWINQWLCKQEFDATSKESALSSTTAADSQHRVLGNSVTTGDKVENGNYIRLEENCELLELRKEVEQYKRSDHQHKKQVQELTTQMKKLTQHLQQIEVQNRDQPDSKSKYFQLQNKFLNAEVIRLSSILKTESEDKTQLTTTMIDLQKNLDTFKINYAFLLQSSLRIYIGDKRNDCAELKLFAFDAHQEHVVNLLNEARKLDPSLPTWESLLPNGPGYVDAYGFRNTFSDVGLALHYAASQLLTFYRSANDQEKRHRWKEYLQRTKSGLKNTKEARTLARAGIPARYRSAIWRCLVHQKVADLKAKYGKYYFRGLSNWQASANDVQSACAHQKQITLDLMRTMPNNVHFSVASQKGVVQLQTVLQAICAHNPRIGYCQGMNFVTAICLLFLNPEDSFWFLVAVTERYFVPNYFDHSLTGAQADQEVLKDILEEKLPELAKHFMKRDIELATVTLNWFLSLFYDSLPFETLLRIWDCFLLEGPKVMFRFVLALLYMHRNTLLECSDTMSILKALKLCAKHTYDVDALVKIAFETLRPFPRRQELIRRQTRYMEILKIRLQRKDELKAVTLANNTFEDVLYQIELMLSLKESEILIVYCCHGGTRKLSLVLCHTGKATDLEHEFDCAVMAATTKNNGSDIFLSLLSGDIISMSVNTETVTSTIHWRKRLPDVVLHLIYYEDDRLFAAMANGTLAVFEHVSERSEPGSLQLYYIPIGAAPLSCLCLVEEETQIWCGIGGRLIALNAKTLDCLERLTIASSSIGCISAVFDRLTTLQLTTFGVWISAFNSSIIQLWDPNTLTCKLIFDTSADHKSLHTQIDSRITCMLALEACVWVGTADGYVLVYDIVLRTADRISKFQRQAPSFVTHSTPSLVKDDPVPPPIGRARTHNSKTELSHRDSGYSGTNSSRYASTEMLQYSGNSGVVEDGTCHYPPCRRRSVMKSRSGSRQDRKRWQSCQDLNRQSTEVVSQGRNGDQGKYTQRQQSSPGPATRKHSVPTKRKESIGTKSVSSLGTSSGGGLEYDDLFVPYPEAESQNPVIGGLLYSSKSRSQSDWSLTGSTMAVTVLTPSPNKTPAAESTFAFTYPDHDLNIDTGSQTWAGNVDGPRKKSRRQLLKRPTRQELKRKDLDLDEYLSILHNSKRRTSSSATTPRSPRQSVCFPQVLTEAATDTDNESVKSNGFDISDTASVLSMSSTGVVEPPYPYRLQCIMRLKIADKPVRCLNLSKTMDSKQCVISCAGGFDEIESILLWTKDPNDQKLWIPQPVLPIEKRPKSKLESASTKALLKRRSTAPWFR